MRPLEKWEIGSTHEVSDLDNIEIASHLETIQEDYQPYTKAKPVLFSNLGPYCSYCESSFNYASAAAVEHIYPKSEYPQYSTKWDNFLLACPRCNSHKAIKVHQGYWPHQHNTYLAFIYRSNGFIDVHPSLSDASKEKAQTLLDLVVLGTPKLRLERSKTWTLAQKLRGVYVNKQEGFPLDVLKELIAKYGHWSVWFTVFQNIPALRQLLIESFPGTARDCFDENYNPIPRNPQNKQDTL